MTPENFPKLLTINQIAQKYFRANVDRAQHAREYILSRISWKIARQYQVGYAPRAGMQRHLIKNKVDVALAEHLGIVQSYYADSTYYDVFSNRVMIPIHHAGMLLGFGGRTLDEKADPRKYINSKTSVLYNKKELLYGLDIARKYIVRRGFVLIVEGYFDVLGLANDGVKNSVAVCGSNLTLGQALLLRRYTSRAYTLFDGDNAGRESGVKARRILKRAGIFRGCLILPKGYDPDTFIREYGRKNLKGLKLIK